MKNIFAFVKNQNVLKWILGVYFLNGCLACLCKNTPLLNIFLTATTAAIGAGLPVWLVWKLTSEKEDKERQQQKRFCLLQEYYNTFHNAVCLTRYRILCEKNKENIEKLNYCSHPFPKILDIAEVTKYELSLSNKKYTALGLSRLLTQFYDEFYTNPKIDKVKFLQDFTAIEIYWMMLVADVLSILGCDVRQDMDVESFVKGLDLVQHKYNKKADKNNVSTEKLSK